MHTLQELAAELTLLAHLLSQPVADSIAALREEAEHAPWLLELLPELQQWPLDAWQGEHTRLFVNGFPKTIAPPFASAWRHGQWGGPRDGLLLDLYQQLGLQRIDTPPDYLGTLLQVTAFCLQQMATSPEQNREQLQPVLTRLVGDELLPWLPAFATALQEGAELALYRSLGARCQAIMQPLRALSCP
jgi:TorA maturation chaperone TorD